MEKIIYFIIWPIAWFISPLTRRARVIIIKDGMILLVVNKLSNGLWGLPGGGLKFGESIIDASKRELKEELNLNITNIRVLNDSLDVYTQSGLIVKHHFVKANISSKSKIKPNYEIQKYDWFKINDLPDVLSEVNRGLKYL